MNAVIHCTDAYRDFEGDITAEELKHFLASQQIVYGLHEDTLSNIVNQVCIDQFPLPIAAGTMPVHGKDGYIMHDFHNGNEKNLHQDSNNFRDVMQIPNVHENDKLAAEVLPTKGMPGKNISGIRIPPRPGKKMDVRAGKNVYFNEGNRSYYAKTEGQVSIHAQLIEVHERYSVHETLSMKTGNIDFVGSVEIYGDVPTGYTVQARGDIRVFGLVEGATLIAGGSIYISEGFAGIDKGTVTAGGDVYVSYVNQGTIRSEQSIFVENSILHSTCTARKTITCQYGNVIGGSLTAGYCIQAHAIGNRLQTKTKIAITANDSMYSEEKKVKEQLGKNQKNIDQLQLLGSKLKEQTPIKDPNLRITVLRQKNSLQHAMNEQNELQKKLEQLQGSHFYDGHAHVTVQKTLYANVTISFGKYERTVQKAYAHVTCCFRENDVTIIPS